MKKLHLAPAAVVLGLGLGLAAGTGDALAGTATANLSVTATVDASCTINTSPVNFGTYQPTAATPTFVSGSLTIACVKGTTPAIGLSGGGNPGLNPGQRAMANAVTSEQLSYFLYKPALATPNTCTTNETDAWGATGTERLEPGATTTINAATYSICGKIPAQQDVSTGSYQDTVIATVEF